MPEIRPPDGRKARAKTEMNYVMSGIFNRDVAFTRFNFDSHDGEILRWFYDFILSGNMETYTDLCGNIFYLIKYGYVCAQLPTLTIVINSLSTGLPTKFLRFSSGS